jgi:phosphoribosylformylglycinamidine cyclo-ligase
MSKNLYKEAGVDIAVGDSLSAFAGDLCRSTYNNSRFVKMLDFARGHFRGPCGFRFKNLPDGYFQTGGADGIGTKVVIIDAAGNYQDAACDLVAMVFEDIARWGGLPLILINVFDARSFGKPLTQTHNAVVGAFMGLKTIADRVSAVLYTGESAELGLCVGSENPDAVIQFNWAGFALGVCHEDKLIRGDTLRPGHVLVALRDLSPGSNGASAIRKIFADRFCPDWWNSPVAKRFVQMAAMPSTLYAPFLSTASGWFHPKFETLVPMHARWHISGGGIKSKFVDPLSRLGFSALLYDLWDPPEILQKCVEWSSLSDEEAYSTWHGGQRCIVAIDESDETACMKLAHHFGLEAKRCGIVLQERKPAVHILSKFTGEMFTYE